MSPTASSACAAVASSPTGASADFDKLSLLALLPPRPTVLVRKWRSNLTKKSTVSSSVGPQIKAGEFRANKAKLTRRIAPPFGARTDGFQQELRGVTP